MAKKVTVDQGLCIGCGLCNSMAPDVFEMGPDGLAETIADTTDNADVDDAAASCPAGAITVE